MPFFRSTLLLPATILTAVFSSHLQSKELLGIRGSVEYWNATMQGSVQSGDVVTTDETLPATAFSPFEMGINEDAYISYAIELRHKFPALPRVIYKKQPLKGEGNATAARDINFIDTAITSGSTTQSDIDLSHTDITLYYPVINSWLDMDIGITQRDIDGKITVDALVLPEEDDTGGGTGGGTGSTAPTAANPNTAVSKNLSLVYLDSSVAIPSTDVRFHYLVHYTNSGSTHYSDVSLHINYAMQGHQYDYFFTAGYKKMKFMDDDFGEASVSLEVAGPFIRFGIGI